MLQKILLVPMGLLAVIISIISSGISTGIQEATNARTVEGHIQNIEYAALEAAFKDDSGDANVLDGTYNSQDSLDKALKQAGVSIPATDKVFCTYYKIVDGTVMEANGCKEPGWEKSYYFFQGINATVEE